jgi:hypothetical protein
LVAKLANLVAVEANWIACVWGLANGYPWLGRFWRALLFICPWKNNDFEGWPLSGA